MLIAKHSPNRRMNKLEVSITTLFLSIGLLFPLPTSASATQELRTPAINPFSITSPVNTAIGSNAIYETTNDAMTKVLLTGTPQVNSTNWSITVVRAKNTDPLVTLTDTGKNPDRSYQVYIPAGTEPTSGTDRAVDIIQPDGVTVYEVYKFNKLSEGNFTGTSISINDLKSDGLQRGLRASGISSLIGLIRTEDIAAKNIPHSIAMSAPASMLKTGPVWPARLQDNQVGSNIYSGVIPMGTQFSIPANVNINSLGLTPEGLALGKALQDYGAHILDQSTTVALYVEPAADAAATARLRTDYQTKLFPQLRRITNNTATTIGGGGTPRQPAASGFVDDPSIIPPSSSEKYVVCVYKDLFSRTPDPTGLAGWSTALDSGTGRVEVANAITYSTEYRSGLINGAYSEFLDRNAEPAGMQSWLTAMGQGLTIQQMESGFLASAEYYAQNGSNNSQWVAKLYKDVLGRSAGASEVQFWVNQLAMGRSRQDVSMGFLISTERLTTVIDSYYVELLNRHIDPVGQQSWVSAIQRGERTEAVIGGIIASSEYYAKT